MTEIAPGVVIDPNVRFGKPIVKGTRLTVEEVLGHLAAGMTMADLKAEFGLTAKNIQAAISYAASFLKGEEVDVPTRRAQ